MTKYLAYCRKSTDEKHKQVLSIKSQVEELKEFARREKLEIVDWITESKTAKSPGRKGFDQLLHLIKEGKANGILSWHPDRLARNSIDGGKLIYLLDTGKLKTLKFPTFWFENTPQGKFMLSIAFGQSKYYVDNLSENVKRGNRHKVKLGIWPNKAPYGYLNNIETKTIKLDPVESKVIKQVFQMFADGNTSFTNISKFLWRNGITKKDGKPIHINQVKRTLMRKFYIGQFFYSGEWHKASHKCFISKQLFEKVQRQIELKNKSKPKNKRSFPFLGLIKCKECGASITAEQHIKHYQRTKRQARYVYYRCTKKLGECSQPYITQTDLTKQLKKKITDIALPASWGKQWFEWLERDKALETLKSKSETVKLEAGIEKLDQRLEKLLDLYLDQDLDDQSYKNKKNKLFEQKLELEEKLKKVRTFGSSWLEPMEKLIHLALHARKIARKENISRKMYTISQTVGSNLFLEDKLLYLELKKPFTSLRAAAIARANSSENRHHSLCVTPRGIEPRFLG